MAQIASSPRIEASSSSSAVHDLTIEKTIAKTIEGIRRILNPYYETITPEEEAAAAIKISQATEKHFQLQIKTLEDAPREPDELREVLNAKQKEYDKAEDSEDIEKLVTEIEMLEYVLFLVRKHGRNSSSSS